MGTSIDRQMNGWRWMDGQTDEPHIDRQTDGWKEGQMDGQADGPHIGRQIGEWRQTDGYMNGPHQQMYPQITSSEQSEGQDVGPGG